MVGRFFIMEVTMKKQILRILVLALAIVMALGVIVGAVYLLIY